LLLAELDFDDEVDFELTTDDDFTEVVALLLEMEVDTVAFIVEEDSFDDETVVDFWLELTLVIFTVLEDLIDEAKDVNVDDFWLELVAVDFDVLESLVEVTDDSDVVGTDLIDEVALELDVGDVLLDRLDVGLLDLQAPVTEGTALAPDPITTMFEPQST